jgi:GNAT superfamily N-acetyltransferase
LVFLPEFGTKMLNDSSFEISTDRSRLDIDLIYRFLSEQSTWAIGISLPVVERSIDNSLCFGGFLDERQVAFARVITDYATFANMVDVFVLPEYRGRGYAKRLVQTIIDHPSLQGLRRFTLATSDSHGLYARFGFTPPVKPETLMERYFPNIYLS